MSSSQQTLLSGDKAASPSKIPVPNSSRLSASKIPLRNVPLKSGAGCREAKPYPVCKKCCCDPPCHDVCEKYKCKKKKNVLCEMCDCEFICFKECEVGKGRRKKAICAECACNEGDCTACCQKKKDAVRCKTAITADKITGGDEIGGEEPSTEPGGGEVVSAVEGNGVVPTDTAIPEEAGEGNAVTDMQADDAAIPESGEQDQAESAMEEQVSTAEGQEAMAESGEQEQITDNVESAIEDTAESGEQEQITDNEESAIEATAESGEQEQITDNVESTMEESPTEAQEEDSDAQKFEFESDKQVEMLTEEVTPQNDVIQEQVVSSTTDDDEQEKMISGEAAVQDQIISSTENEGISSSTDKEQTPIDIESKLEDNEVITVPTKDETLPPIMEEEPEISPLTEHLLQQTIMVDGVEIVTTELTDEDLHNLPADLQKEVEEAMAETRQETEITSVTEHVLQKVITVDGVEIGTTDLTDEELHNLPPDLQKEVEEAMGETTQETEISPVPEHVLQKTIMVDGIEIGATELTDEELHNLPPDLQKEVEEAMGETTQETDMASVTEHLLQKVITVDGVEIGTTELTEEELQNLPPDLQKEVEEAMGETTQETEISPFSEHVLQKTITVDGIEIGATELTEEELHNLPPDLQKEVEEAMGETTHETEISPLTEHLLQKMITVDGVEIGATELTDEELRNLPPNLQKEVEEAMGETMQKTVTIGGVEINVVELNDEEIPKGPADIQEQVNAVVIVEGAEVEKQTADTGDITLATVDDVNIDAGDQQLIADTKKDGLAEIAACVCNELACQETCVGIKSCKQSPCMDCSCIVEICRRVCKEFLEANNIPIINPEGTNKSEPIDNVSNLTEGDTTEVTPDLNEDCGEDTCFVEMQEGDANDDLTNPELKKTCGCDEENVGPLDEQQEPASGDNEDGGAGNENGDGGNEDGGGGDEQTAPDDNEQNPPDNLEQINADKNEEFSDAVEQIDTEQNNSGGVEDQPPTCAIVKCCTLPSCMTTNEAQVQTPPPQTDASCVCNINKPSQDMVTCVPSCTSKSTNFMSHPAPGQTQSGQIQTAPKRNTCSKTASRPSTKRKKKPCYCDDNESDATISDSCTSSCSELMRHDMTDCDCAKPQKKGAGAAPQELDMLVRQINCGCCQFKEQRGGTYAKELDDVVTQIQTSCINAESMMSPFVKSIFQPTLSALESTVSKVRARSRQQLVAADTKQFGGGSSNDQSATRITKPSTSIFKKDDCPTCPGRSPNPTPLMVSCIRRLGPASLIVNWEASHDDRIVGYEVTVNGKIKARVLDRLRTSALLDTLDLRRALTISVFAFSNKGRCEPPAQATFNGRAGECTHF